MFVESTRSFWRSSILAMIMVAAAAPPASSTIWTRGEVPRPADRFVNDFWLSGFGVCPLCGHRTLRREITRTCDHCDYVNTEPDWDSRHTDAGSSFHSVGGGFGGGQSSGGGATGGFEEVSSTRRNS